jgi:carbamoyltransferase
MEYGPRALGGRSILGDARSPKMQAIMNEKIKLRESFRPFAPSVLAERAKDYFALEVESPYMMLVAPVRDDLPERSQIPAVTHVDHSARVQTIDEARHGRYHRLVERFAARTGCPVVVNTSFNVRGEPIVCRPEEAIRCFLATDMDALVLERSVLLKSEQTAVADRQAHLGQFELD